MSQSQMQPNYAYNPPPPSAGLAIASMVLGIISLFVCLSWLAAICGILAIIFGIIARNKVRDGTGSGEGMAKAGLIMGCIGLAFDLLIIVLALTFGVSFMKWAHQQQQRQMQQQQQNGLPGPAMPAAPTTPPAGSPDQPPSTSQSFRLHLGESINFHGVKIQF